MLRRVYLSWVHLSTPYRRELRKTSTIEYRHALHNFTLLQRKQ
uniref:Uncharacterized protein n=1 Tax=Arundo donax TaxID=35708 RepID=A0A0A8Z308_ARUDO